MTGLEDALIVSGTKAAAPIVARAISQSIEYVKSVSSSITDRVSRDLRLGYSDFLIASYNRCQQVKTVVTGDQPVSLLEVYVNLDLISNEIPIKDDGLIDTLEEYRRIVITGTGGAGKSMLMKYLVVTRFENCKGRIPLFVELRSLNSITAKDILPFCFASCSTAKQKVTYANFEKVFAAGGFILVLDGFDEIDSEHKDLIERQILELGRKFPESIIIVSSRNDSRFKGWQDYHIFEVSKLTQVQVKGLIQKVKYEAGIKRRFLKELPELWRTHESFLSIPLLSVIMLLTFGKFSEISPKATLFYKLAFQTLFREHDANKEQFKRPIYTKLELDDFERSFAAFCAISYLESKYSFERKEAVKFTNEAMKYCRLSFDPSSYLNDLIQNVCMLQEEGTELTYVHRSFQEYFTALFLVGYHESNLFEVINEVAVRENDSTLSMFKELDEVKFEISWLIPTLDDLIASLSAAISSGSPTSALNWIFRSGIYSKDLTISGLALSSAGRSSIIRQIGKLYPSSERKLSIGRLFEALMPANFVELLHRTGASKRKPIARLLRQASSDHPNRDEMELKYSSDNDDWLIHTNVMGVMKSILLELKKIQKGVQTQRLSQSNVIVLS